MSQVLDYFEYELEREDRMGRWLAGPAPTLADISLGLVLHRYTALPPQLP